MEKRTVSVYLHQTFAQKFSSVKFVDDISDPGLWKSKEIYDLFTKGQHFTPYIPQDDSKFPKRMPDIPNKIRDQFDYLIIVKKS